MGLIFWLVFDGAIIGLIIAVMQRGEFPGWGPAIGTVVVIALTTAVVNHFLPNLWPLGPVAGAAAGALVIHRVCYMDLRRAAIASGVYLAARILVGLALRALTSF